MKKERDQRDWCFILELSIACCIIVVWLWSLRILFTEALAGQDRLYILICPPSIVIGLASLVLTLKLLWSEIKPPSW